MIKHDRVIFVRNIFYWEQGARSLSERARRIMKAFVLLGFLCCGLSACSMDASIESLSKEITTLFSKAIPAEVVPASSQGVYTAKGYEVQASVSYYNAKPEVVTSKGYIVQTNIQSTLFKE